jgi:hypothetical protein
MRNEIVATAGSDVRLMGRFMPPPEESLDLSGFNLAVLLGPSSALAGRVSVAWTDLAERRFEVFIEGTDPLPTGTYAFRVQLVGDGLDRQSARNPAAGRLTRRRWPLRRGFRWWAAACRGCFPLPFVRPLPSDQPDNQRLPARLRRMSQRP